MSIRVMTAVFDHSQSRLADRLVLLVIADRAHDDGTGCYRSRESIAEMAGVSPRQVTESVRRLREMGELEVVARAGQSNLYRVTLEGSARPLADSATPPSRLFQTGVAESSTNSSIDTSLIQGAATGVAPNGTDPQVRSLVAGFVDDYRAVCDGHDPPRAWTAAAGKAVKSALKDQESAGDIATCLGLVAREGKHPSTLQYVLSDMHANRPRRVAK